MFRDVEVVVGTDSDDDSIADDDDKRESCDCASSHIIK